MPSRFVAPATDDTLFNKSVAGSSTDTMSGLLAHGRPNFEKGRHAWRRVLNRGGDDNHAAPAPIPRGRGRLIAKRRGAEWGSGGRATPRGSSPLIPGSIALLPQRRAATWVDRRFDRRLAECECGRRTETNAAAGPTAVACRKFPWGLAAG